MKKYLIILTVSILILLKMLFSFITNEIIVYNYNKNIFNTNLINSLYFINFPESYIVYYNHGNLLYKEEQYEEAILKYNDALNKRPPEKKVCAIRINLSLSIVATANENNPTEALEKLKEAREVLYVNNCANEADDSGNSEEAEQLEDEIKELEEKLKGNNTEDDVEEKDNNEEQESEEDNTESDPIEEQLKEQLKESAQNRQESIEYENNSNYSYYDGKKW